MLTDHLPIRILLMNRSLLRVPMGQLPTTDSMEVRSMKLVRISGIRPNWYSVGDELSKGTLPKLDLDILLIC